MSVSGIFQNLRRLTGAVGPVALKSGQLFINQVDNTLYVGYGDDGSGNSTSQMAIGGVGAFVDKASTQTIAGTKTFSASPQLPSPTANDSSANAAPTSWVQALISTVSNLLAPKASPTFTGTVTVPTATAGDNSTAAASTAFVTSGLATAVALLAPKAGPTFTGAVNIPTATAGDSSTLAANTSFVQTALSALANGLQVKATANYATAAALPSNTYSSGVITASANGVLSVDGASPPAGSVVLVKNEAQAANNGLYVVTNAGASGAPFVLTRHADMASAAQFLGAFIPVGAGGTANGNSLWLCNPSGTVVLGTTAIPFTQLNGATNLTQGALITISGNTIAVSGVTSLTTGTMLKYDGTKLVNAVAGTDYVAPGSTYDSGTA